ncbi:hypothetical protein [Umezawaea tangerina]|uniref:Hydrolytic protein n=1 Tax=Umezawaea tangerina TaxID=84725 RepID=A0A2T0T090_9PSEU|nr:hypothetical protein [Umezawaea tangerina]PRY39059.1 hypothetical protein CLV43_108459 [Umezawaea tangerina]
MKTTTLLGDPSLSVDPGEQVRRTIRVHNTGGVVDRFTVDVIGDAAAWTEVTPAAVNLLPDGHVEVDVVFSPPRSTAVLAGQHHVGVRVRSREDPDSSSVEEVVVEVGAFAELDAELLPSRRRSRRGARYRLAVENSGNTPMRVGIDPFDPEDDLVDIRLNRESFTLHPATVALVAVKVRPYRRFLRGEPRPHPFELRLAAEPAVESDVEWTPLTVKGELVQERLLPGWVLPVLALLLVLAVALGALWFTVVAPGIKSIASEQASGAAADASLAASIANAAADKANGSAQDAAADLSSAAAITSTTPPPTPSPLSFRVATFAAPTTDGSFQRFGYAAPGGKALEIGDIVLQNPRGDVGYLRVLIGETVLLETGLANFHDLTYAYSTRLRVPAGQQLVVAVNCVTPGQGSARCTAAASFSAMLQP